MAALAVVASATGAAAHRDPPDCLYSDPELILEVFRSDKQTGVVGTVSDCESLYFRATLRKPSPSACAIDQGTWSITLPDGSEVSISSDVPCVGGTTGGCFSEIDQLVSDFIPYGGDPTDAEGGFFHVQTTYTGGFSHTGTTAPADVTVTTPKAVPVSFCLDDDKCTMNGCHSLLPGSSACSSIPVVCNDGNACTNDSCDSQQGCVFESNVEECDDGLECTNDGCDPQAGCVNTPKNCDDGNPCTVDSCSPGTGLCANPPGGSALCRPANNSCDAAEFCNGTSAACPANAFLASTTMCRAAASVCDTAEFCTGTSNSCPIDVAKGSRIVCRPSAGVCDPPELCTVSGTTCPADELSDTTVFCRPSGGSCDFSERCTGSSATCPVDTVRASTHVCRPAATVCDGVETCTGSTATCPEDVLAPSTQVCRPASAGCDAVERCTGTSGFCPPNVNATAGTVCRSTAGECDIAEACDGTSSACPADVRQSAGIPCSTDNNPCTDDRCGGSASCEHFPTDDPCNDGDDCTLDDECAGGQCTGEPDPACTTTTTLPEVLCGDANGDGNVSAADAQIALRTAVGLANCDLAACDYNGDGDVKTGDALLILRVAVGQPVEPNCAASGLAMTPPRSTTTTVE